MIRRILLAGLAAWAVIAGEGLARAQAPGGAESKAASKVQVEKHPSDQLATWIDARFEELWKEAGVEQGPAVDDGTYLRRVYLDLVGTIPSVAVTRDFLADPRTDKRSRVVDQLIGESRSNAHLSRVWRRMMVPMGSPGMGMAGRLEPWLQQQFAARVPYDKFARELVTAKGAAGGAAGGAAIGAIAGDAGTGAAIGATAGAVRGRRQQKKANKQAEQQAQQQGQAQQQQRLDTFRRAFSACLDSKGYSVK
jgi:hypothetical protein